MKKVGPKLPQGDIEVDPTEMGSRADQQIVKSCITYRSSFAQHQRHLFTSSKKQLDKLPKNLIQDPEEEHEFLEQLLRSRELNCLVKMHNVILFCNQGLN